MYNFEDVVIVSGCRTAVGSFGGSLKNTSAIDLGATVVQEAVKRICHMDEIPKPAVMP